MRSYHLPFLSIFSTFFSFPFTSLWLRWCFLKVRQEQRLATVLSYPLSCLPSNFFFSVHSLLILPCHHFLLVFFFVFFHNISASTSSFLPLLSVFYFFLSFSFFSLFPPPLFSLIITFFFTSSLISCSPSFPVFYVCLFFLLFRPLTSFILISFLIPLDKL